MSRTSSAVYNLHECSAGCPSPNYRVFVCQLPMPRRRYRRMMLRQGRQVKMAPIPATDQTEFQRWVADDRLRSYSRREARAEDMFWRGIRYQRLRRMRRLVSSRRPAKT